MCVHTRRNGLVSNEKSVREDNIGEPKYGLMVTPYGHSVMSDYL